ncbi:MAG: hypothetical protein ACXAC8_17655 [Candidatus Hodarchaeales archaeon]|jgi:hypothetical protein
MKIQKKKVIISFVAIFAILLTVSAMAQAAPQVANSGILSMDLLIDDGWILAVDDTVATDPDDVFLTESGTGLNTLLSLPTDKIFLPKNLDVDLENTQFYSDPAWAAHELGGSRLFMNSSARAGTTYNSSMLAVTTELSFSAEYGECKATSTATPHAADSWVEWRTQLEEDRDADGVVDETGDEEWLTKIDGDEWFLVHLAMASDAASSSTDNFAELILSFKTTSGTYNYTIRLFEYAGDTDTTVGSITNGERAEFYSVGASTTFEHVIYLFDMAAVIADDSESPSIVGLDDIYHRIQMDTTANSKYITLRNYGVTVYQNEIGITDNVDDDSDYDYDTSGIPANFADDSDFPSSEITDNSGTTDDTYDNLLDLEHSVESGDILKAPIRKIKFVSDSSYEMELEPTKMDIRLIAGYDTSKNGYLVQMDASYDWNWLDYGGNPTTYISWTASSSKLMLEWELEFDQMAYVVDADDDPALAIFRDANSEGGYILQGVDQTAELIAAWDGQADDSAITDILLSEPSQTLGGQDTTVMLKVFMREVPYGQQAPSPVIAIGQDPTGQTGIIAGIVSIFAAVLGFFGIRWVRSK